ncbi:hypothetical protein [Gemmobacter aquatilis]|uniref:hypothetical protein n=1 Tax=Gemmobacter aquatilis TaxID=933059 RepID=UPI00111364A7|nr:hypothetical protein [Gemmobacter aquatilis]
MAGTIATALTACVETTPQVVYDEHTNQTVVFSRTVDAYSGLLNFVKARAFYNRDVGYGVETLISNYGWIHPQEVWSFGKKFPYKNTTTDVGMCGGAGGCITTEKGLFVLTEAQFKQAAQTGIEFKIIGAKGSFVGKISPDQFAEVLALIGKQ